MTGWFPLFAPPGVFSTLQIGGGGFVSGLDMQPDGTALARTDTYGGYLLNRTSGLWQQLVTRQSMPSPDNSFDTILINQGGAYELIAAPSNTSTLYMLFNGYVFKSTNKGATWTHTIFAQDLNTNTQDGGRLAGKYIAVDLSNENIVYVGTPTKLSVSSDGGATWNPVTAAGVPVPTSTTAGGVMIAFDTTSLHPGNVTQTIYAASPGNGVYVTTNGGTSWAKTAGTNPTTFQKLVCDQAGTVWVVNGSGTLNRFISGAWSARPTATNLCGVAVNPADSTKVYCATNDSKLYVSTDSGGTFVGPTAITVTSSDIPWLAAQGAGDGQFTAGHIAFDPFGSNALYLTNGIGIFTTIPQLPFTATFTNGSASISGANAFSVNQPVTLTTTSVLPTNFATNTTYFVISAGLSSSTFQLAATVGGAAIAAGSAGSGTQTAIPGNIWASKTAGVENLDVNAVVGIATGKPLVGCWDRPAFLLTPGTFPSSYGGASNSGNLGSGWSIDVDPTGAVGVVLGSGISTFGCYSSVNISTGAWTTMGSQVPVTTNSTIAGSIAASTTTDFLALPKDSNGSINQPWNTGNGGTAWSARTVGAVSTARATGWGTNYYENTFWAAADKVTAGKYYIYNDGSGTAGNKGVWSTTDSGATWTHVFSGGIGSGGFNGKLQMKAVPGQANHLFSACGKQGTHVDATTLQRSTDGGQTWGNVTAIREPWCVGFGKNAPGQSYPSVYVIGWGNGTADINFGLYRSIDNCVSFQKIGDGFPGGTLTPVYDIYGDMGIYGTVYMATLGNGCYQGVNL